MYVITNMFIYLFNQIVLTQCTFHIVLNVIYVNQESPINVYTWVILDKNIVNK